VTIFLLVLTWYLTKVYYSGKMSLDLHPDTDGVQQICYSCGKRCFVDKENARNPFYCTNCG